MVRLKEKEGKTYHDIALMCGMQDDAVRKRIRNYQKEHPSWRETSQRDTWVLELNDSRIRNVMDAVKKAGVDLRIWSIERIVVNGYDVTMKIKKDGNEEPFRAQNNQIKIFLKRIVPVKVEDAITALLKDIEDKSPIVPKIKRHKPKKVKHRRIIEIALPDLHFGGRFFSSKGKVTWSPELCANMVMEVMDELIDVCKYYQPFEQVIMPVGNDLFHSDNLWQTTTKGTQQPESESYYQTITGAERMVVGMIEKAKKLADVVYYSIPGNHDRATSFLLGRIMAAYYRNDKNVTVHADCSPYKFHEFGVNLIGFEHGKSINKEQLAGLMANECPESWARTKYREWHLGHEHRVGTITLEKQGVSVQYLPTISPPYEWMNIKGFSWQKRAAVGYIWDYDCGQIAMLPINIDSRLNRIMGK